ncbi:MAG: PIG-L family deacetylase [Planctomycetes bacterium]|nr:PIG-L family deacetylase [Planctomycetota bacterium]
MSLDRKVVFAVAAHPDDIEFMMSGTLMLLRDEGYELHYINIANGSCGTTTMSHEEIAALRSEEARAAAGYLGATWHPSLTADIEIFYEKTLLARLAAVVRQVNPTIMLVPSPDDYMEDHVNASRLAVTAAFCRSMKNFPTSPAVPPVEGDVTIYHALPYGLHNAMGRRVFAGQYVDAASVLDAKKEMLALHKSQKEWLDASQGLDAYIAAMEEMCAEVGKMSGVFKYAEGWRRHWYLGFAAEDEDTDPLSAALGEKTVTDRNYERNLEMPSARRPK